MQQQQRLTPQLIQAMDILQLPMLALESRIAQEIDANPALEVAGADDEYAPNSESNGELPRQESPEEDRPAVAADGSADFERLGSLVREYDYLDDEGGYRRPRAPGGEEGDAKFDAMANTSARGISLAEHLQQQWRFANVEDATRRIGLKIIDSLDDDGQLRTPLESIAAECVPPVTVAQVEEALHAVQKLEPAGVAARSLQESLLLQIAALPGDNALETRILREHFDDLQKNRLPQIAKALNIELQELKDAIAAIGTLSMHPGMDLVERQSPTVIPDVIVEYDEEAGHYVPRLARGNSRELRIAPEFRELLEQSRGDKHTRDFVKQKLEAAAAIIDAIRFRRERLLEVAREVVEAQRDFLDKGEQHLRPLKMADLAERLHCDPSTISRTVDEKYIQTPRGVFPLRRFFSGGAETDTGEVLGWDSIKAKVAEIVEKENKSNPLSDDEIVEVLLKQGVDIKRRTVAKYRSQLDIPTARQRRQY